ncbi:Uma2 family endonuclease [Rudanella paleaurantiibacter]|uniref:Uma2 family endonuclease n=1 Tax=Rudanella paleaurantiibacter TaxID=2614655 RepID=A0A7J5TXZ6_9BACT|nr:Uma2 family endonuclease [Rudanella paleaurantiibacter]KAB7728441.1 Uma2 family endonuclease [Rudanella paleaurantiibacter]
METITKPMTYEEFRAMEFSAEEEKANVFELIDGEIVAKNHPTATHQSVLLELAVLVKNFLSTTKSGKAFIAPFGVVPEPNTDVQPDLFVLLDANLPNLQEDGFFGAPDLVVEIISPSSIRLDRNTKFKLYERTGVAEYWIVDPRNQSIEVYGRTTAGFDLVSFAAESGTVESGVLAGLSVDVTAVFAG